MLQDAGGSPTSPHWPQGAARTLARVTEPLQGQPWLSPPAQDPELAWLALRPRQFLQQIPVQLPTSDPAVYSQESRHGGTEDRQLCLAPGSSSATGQSPRSPLCTPGQGWGSSASPPSRVMLPLPPSCLPVERFLLHGLPQLALVLLPQAAELVLGAELGRWRAGELDFEGGGGEVDLGQRQRVSRDKTL